VIRHVILVSSAVLLMGQSVLPAAPDCSAAMTQTDMNICAGNAYKAADADLTKVYHDLMMKVSDAGKIGLRDAERAWILYRDKECAFETAGSVGGSVHSMVLSLCLTQKTNTRVAELGAQLNCEEGDVACGAQ
jgi:uncharacterized protein YecT (DUF1311 family)